MDRDVPRRIVSAALAIALLLCGAYAQPLVKPWQAKWDEGSPNCAAHHRPPLEVHEFNPRTFVLRENLCATWEANFIYLLIGSRRALLIDTGDVADPKKMPLARSVMWLLSRYGAAGLPLLVVHTHRHLDHRAGDPQFEHLRNVQVVGYDLVSVKQYYGFADWPEGHAHIDLGNRIIDVLPAPGHEATHIVLYDRNTTLLFSGDFMMPGRLLLDDPAADLASAIRVADFVRNKPVAAVLGGHIEEDTADGLFPWESTYHPKERRLEMSKADLLALPSALSSFNGFYERIGNFTIIAPIRNLMALAGLAVVVLGGLIAGVIIYLRNRRRRSSI